jgi:hypothetical protein
MPSFKILIMDVLNIFKGIKFNLLTNQSNPSSRVLATLLVPNLVNKFPTVHGTQKFITGFTKASHMSKSLIHTVLQSYFLRFYLSYDQETSATATPTPSLKSQTTMWTHAELEHRVLWSSHDTQR